MFLGVGAHLHLPIPQEKKKKSESDSLDPNTLVLRTQWIDYCTSGHVKKKEEKIHLKKALHM